MPKASAQAAEPDTRQRLVLGAQRVIAEHGWSGVTTRRVAAEAGVNPGLVHYHFGSVAELRRAAVLAVLELAGADAAAGRSAELSRADLGELMGNWLHLQQHNPQAASVLLHGSLACLHDEALREEVERMLGSFRRALAAWLRQQGHDEDDAARLSALISAALDGALLHHLIDPAMDPDEILQPLLQLAARPSGDEWPRRPEQQPEQAPAHHQLSGAESTKEHP